MAYDEALADRVRRVVGPRQDVTERKMFGGIAFLLDGKMFCGVVRGELMVRVGPAGYDAALARRHVRPMDFTGRPMNGYVFVSAEGCKTDASVAPWAEASLSFVAPLPIKPPRPRKPRPPARRPTRR